MIKLPPRRLMGLGTISAVALCGLILWNQQTTPTHILISRSVVGGGTVDTNPSIAFVLAEAGQLQLQHSQIIQVQRIDSDYRIRLKQIDVRIDSQRRNCERQLDAKLRSLEQIKLAMQPFSNSSVERRRVLQDGRKKAIETLSLKQQRQLYQDWQQHTRTLSPKQALAEALLL